MICPAVCSTHGLGHSDSVFHPHNDIVSCQCLDRGCLHDVLLRFGSQKTVLVISRSYSSHFLRSRIPLLLHLPMSSHPIIPSQVWWSVPTLALKSPRRMSLSVRGVVEIVSRTTLVFLLLVRLLRGIPADRGLQAGRGGGGGGGGGGG